MTELDPTIRVDRKNPLNKPSGKIPRGASKETSPVGNVDRVTLSGTSKTAASVKSSTASDIRRDLVEKFRTVLADGSYQVKAQEIADKMVQKIRENKNRLIL